MTEEEIPVISDNTLQLYGEYCGIKDPNELSLHLINIRTRLDKEGKINYRCIQRYKFAFSRIYHRFFYKKIIHLGQHLLTEDKKPYFLDIGCCTGTDLRKLLLDGYPKDYLIGLDIEQSYIDCGYALFKDSPTTCPIQFIVDDLFNCTLQQMTMIHAGSVFHLFQDEHMMQQFTKRITQLLKPGGLFVGGHVCTEQSTEYFRQSTNSLKFYMGVEQFRQMLKSQGFSDIEIEIQPRLGHEDDANQNFIAFWISFFAVYNPTTTY